MNRRIAALWPALLAVDDDSFWSVARIDQGPETPPGVELYGAVLFADERHAMSRYLIAAANVSPAAPTVHGPAWGHEPALDDVVCLAHEGWVYACRLNWTTMARHESGEGPHPVDELMAEVARLGVTVIA